MSKFTYNGDNRSIKVAGVLFEKGVETEITAEQDKALKANAFGRAFLDDGSIVEVKSETKKDAKNDKG